MHIHASKVRLPTNIEPTYSLKRVPTQGTACKTKQKQNKTKQQKRKKDKNTQISGHQYKVPVWNIKQNKTKKVFQNSCDKCSNFIGIPSVV